MVIQIEICDRWRELLLHRDSLPRVEICRTMNFQNKLVSERQ
jgi:hypothetical protein